LVIRNWHVPCSVSPQIEQTRIGAILFSTQTTVELEMIMKRLSHMLALVGATAVLTLGAANLAAQERPERDRGDRGGRGNFDPEQMRQRMMERYREDLEVKNDDEWKLIEARITKVADARREIGFGGGMRFGGGRRGGDNGGDQGGRRGSPGGNTSNPEVESLQKAIEAKAPAEELKAKLAKVREARKQKEANLAKAQDDLRKVLSVRQEASAVLMGLLQ
jgi:hypothetical protein